jgi:hypothetical protein
VSLFQRKINLNALLSLDVLIVLLKINAKKLNASMMNKELQHVNVSTKNVTITILALLTLVMVKLENALTLQLKTKFARNAKMKKIVLLGVLL